MGIITRSKLPDDIIAVAPRLRAVVVHGTGTDLVPIADATARGVMVANLPGGNAQSVAEYCVLAAIQVPPSDKRKFADFLEDLGYDYVEESANIAYRMFLGR